jgi:hypothetical protein
MADAFGILTTLSFFALITQLYRSFFNGVQSTKYATAGSQEMKDDRAAEAHALVCGAALRDSSALHGCGAIRRRHHRAVEALFEHSTASPLS